MVSEIRWISLSILVTSVSLADAGELIDLPSGNQLREVDFDRHVVPLLSRYGCNSGSCHGSFQGRGGMRLSLFGHSAAMDYVALSERIDVDSPEESLLLLKPTDIDSHEGGRRFEKDSWPYHVIRRWITDGGGGPEISRADVHLSVSPARVTFDETTEQPLAVQAEFGNLPPIEVTDFCRFSSDNEGVVTVDEVGTVRSVGPGTSFVTVEYLGQFGTVAVSVGYRDAEPRGGDVWESQLIENSRIDQLVNDRLRELNLDPSPPASDEAFLRRITLDTLARLPTIEEIQAYAKDRSQDRREKLIERLLRDDRHASLWATRLCDMTRCTTELMESPDQQKLKRAKMWHDWFRVRFANNIPYDQIVRGVLVGTSRGEDSYDDWLDSEAELIRKAREGFDSDYHQRPFLDLYWRRTKDGVYPRKEVAEITSAAFLGIQLECAQCHKHPYDHWTQADYRSFVNVFAQVQFGSSTDLNTAVLQRLQQRREAKAEERPAPLPRVSEVFNSRKFARPLGDPATGKALAPKPLGGPAFDEQTDPREQLMEFLDQDPNRQMARNFANRIWAHYFGRGMVEPVDRFSAINPATHPELLEHLTDVFVQSGYDVRNLEREVLSTATYQRSSRYHGNNNTDTSHFARAYVRPLMAEAAIDVLHQSLGVALDTGDALPNGATAIELATDRIKLSFRDPEIPIAERMLNTFGRGPRNSACDCDRESGPSLRQSLFQMSDPWILTSIRDGELMSSLMAQKPAKPAVEFVFQRVLARMPTDVETQAAINHLADQTDAREAWTDIVWALVNTREFLTNH